MATQKTQPTLGTRHLLGIEPLSIEDIELILVTAQKYQTRTATETRPVRHSELLRGKTLALAFFEPSTRTRVSFEMAAQRLGMHVVNLVLEASSVQKGESLLDTVKTLAAMRPDALVIRHSGSGVPHFLARHTSVPILNAGDGAHEHPTQALLDAFTIRERKPRLAGLKVAIVGDLLHSRVLRSNVLLLTKLGAEVWVCAPATLIPPGMAGMGVRVTTRVDEAVEGADVIMMLRIQLERMQGGYFPSLREYFTTFGMTEARVARAKPDVIIMHPGPINRGVEIASEVADGAASVILDQVANGVAVRMAVLYLLAGGTEHEAVS